MIHRKPKSWAVTLALLVGPAIAIPVTTSTAAVSSVAIQDPAGITVRGEDLIVAEAGKGRLLTVQPDGTKTTLIDRLIPGLFTRGPTGVTVDGDGNAYVGVAEDGVILFATPSGETGVYARGLGSPNGIAFDEAGNLYVADQAGRRVLRITPDRDWSIAAEGFSAAPFAVVLGPDGSLFVSTQRDAKVWRVGASGELDEFAALEGSAEGLAFDEAGNLYVGNGRAGEIVRIPSSGGTGVTVATAVSGPLNLAFSASGLHASAQGEGAAGTGDSVTLAVPGVVGFPLAAPPITPTPLAEAPDHSFAHMAGGVAVDQEPFLDILPRGTATSVGLGAFEPTIGVTRTGAVFFNPKPTASVNTQHVMRSTDQGKTWEDVSPGLPPTLIVPPTDLDPYIYVDRDTGRLFTIQLYVGCSFLAYSDDDGETWIPNPIACGVPGNDHQTLYSGPTSILPTVGYENALYYCWNGVAYSGCSRSLDGGLTFEAAGIPYGPTDPCAGLHGHVAVGPDGTVYLPKGDCSTGPAVSVSHDDGTTWDVVQVAGPEYRGPDHESHVATDSEGNAYYVWTGADRRPYLSVSKDAGLIWSEPMMIGPPGITTAWGPSIAAGDKGKIAIYYYGTTAECCYEPRQPGGHTMWNTYATVSVDALADDPVFLTTTFNDPVDPVRRGTCGPGRCGGRPTSPGDFVETFVDHTGRMWAAVVDTCMQACAAPGLKGTNNAELGMAGQLVGGPKLFGEGVLEPPPWFDG